MSVSYTIIYLKKNLYISKILIGNMWSKGSPFYEESNTRISTSDIFIGILPTIKLVSYGLAYLLADGVNEAVQQSRRAIFTLCGEEVERVENGINFPYYRVKR